jgi:hypothetical protein
MPFEFGKTGHLSRLAWLAHGSKRVFVEDKCHAGERDFHVEDFVSICQWNRARYGNARAEQGQAAKREWSESPG